MAAKKSHPQKFALQNFRDGSSVLLLNRDPEKITLTFSPAVARRRKHIFRARIFFTPARIFVTFTRICFTLTRTFSHSHRFLSHSHGLFSHRFSSRPGRCSQTLDWNALKGIRPPGAQTRAYTERHTDTHTHTHLLQGEHVAW